MLNNVRNICRENKTSQWFATDQLESCDPSWVNPIEYSFNSRGFRDREWPSDLTNVIWFVGGSELLGTGVAYQDAPPRVVENLTQRRCIDISIQRASNNWIARQVHNILDSDANPQTIVVQWSFTTRWELSKQQAKDQELQWLYQAIKLDNWPEQIKSFAEYEKLPEEIQYTIAQDEYFQKICNMSGAEESGQIHYKKELLFNWAGAKHTLDLVRQIEQKRNLTQVIYTFVPKFAEPDEREFVYKELDKIGADYIPEYNQIDLARDRSHSGPETFKLFGRRITAKIEDL